MSSLRLSRRSAALVVALSTVILVGAGCARPRTSAPSDAANQPASDAAAPTTPQEACGNPYFALPQGLRVDFESETKGQKIAYSLTVQASNAGAEKLVYEFPSLEFVFAQDIDCANGAVTTDTFLNMAAATGQMKTESQKAEGELMPKDVHVGSTWSTRYETVVTNTVSEVAGTVMTMKLRTDSKAVGEEKVTVPAGTYDALKVETTSTSDVTLGEGSALPSSTTTATQWWVKGIGLVKQVAVGKGATTTTSATKVTMP